MAKPGRKPTPTAELKLRGSWRAKTRKKEPTPKLKAPTCPAWLKGRTARAEWARLVRLLTDCRVLTEQDRTMLAGHCQALEEYLRYRDVALRDGEFHECKNGAVRAHPALTHMDRAFARMLRTGAALGLSPADRTRVEAIPDETGGVESIDDFVKRREQLA